MEFTKDKLRKLKKMVWGYFGGRQGNSILENGLMI